MNSVIFTRKRLQHRNYGETDVQVTFSF